MPNVELSGESLLITLAVILIVLEAISVISKGVEGWKKLTGRDERVKAMNDVKERIGKLEKWRLTVDARLKEGDELFKKSDADAMMSLLALHRIVKHLQTGNDHEKLKETDDQMYEYLLKRGVKKEVLE